MTYRETVSDSAKTRVQAVFSVEPQSFADTVEIPPDPKMGDFAVPCFPLAKQLRMAPPAIAAKLAQDMTPPEGFSRVENAGGYLNFFVDRTAYARDTVGAVLAQGEKYGGSEEGAGKTILLDYSSINIMKRFHMGHLSTTMIGHALKRVYEHLGYTCVGINHLGDWGTQFGKLIVAYKHW